MKIPLKTVFLYTGYPLSGTPLSTSYTRTPPIITMYTTVVMPIKPRAEQRRAIDAALECNRIVFNASVTAIRLFFEGSGRLPTEFEMNRLVTRMRGSCPMLRTAYSETEYDAAHRALRGYGSLLERDRKDHYRKTREPSWDYYPERLSRPRYRKRERYHSYSYIGHGISSVIAPNADGRDRRYLKLGKVKGLVKCLNQDAAIEGEPVRCTITRKDYGTHYEYEAAVTFEKEDAESGVERLSGDPEIIGVDLGVSHIAALSDGTVYDNPHDFEKARADLQKKHRALSRALPGSERERRCRNRLRRSYARLGNKRKDRTECISKDIARSADVVVLEKLSIKQMKGRAKSRGMHNAYADASLGSLIRRIVGKAEGAACTVVFVDPRGTSRECSACGADVPKKLSDRVHRCPRCGLVMDRDVNAAINIMARGSARDPFPAGGESPRRTAGARVLWHRPSGHMSGCVRAVKVRVDPNFPHPPG